MRVLEVPNHVVRGVRNFLRDQDAFGHVLQRRSKHAARPLDAGHGMAGVAAVLFDQDLPANRIAAASVPLDRDDLFLSACET